jgi:hypothetical protein
MPSLEISQKILLKRGTKNKKIQGWLPYLVYERFGV